MKSTARHPGLLLCALIAVLSWTGASTIVAGKNRPGFHLTPNGFRSQLYGVSQTRDANGKLVAGCEALNAPQVDAARFGRRVSRALAASDPQVVVQGPAGGGSFNVTYTDPRGSGFNDLVEGAARRAAFEAALASWSKAIEAPQTIRVNASMYEMDDGDDDPSTTLLAIGSPSEFWVHDNKTLVPSALALQLNGFRFANAGDVDIAIDVNDQAPWDYSVNSTAFSDRVSLVYTVMHELAHGLGFIDSFDSETGLPANDPLPFVFDEFVNRGSARRNPVISHTPDAMLGDITSKDLFFNGPIATVVSRLAGRSAPMLKLYAPDPYAMGSSISHFDQDTYEASGTVLMTPFLVGSGNKIDSQTLAVMKDLGYDLARLPTTTASPERNR